MLALVLLVTLVGTTLLCFSMRRHHVLVFGGAPTTARSYAMRGAGYATLLLAAVLASLAMGTGIGLTAFVAAFTLAVLLCAFAVTWLNARS